MNHQIVVHSSQADHCDRAKNIADHFRHRPRFQPSRSRNQFRTNIQPNHHIGPNSAQLRFPLWMGRHQNRGSSGFAPLRKRPVHKRSSSARRQPHQNILLSDSPLDHGTCASVRIILRSLLCPKNRLGSARQNRLHLLRRRMERRWHLARIQHSQPATGPRTHIDQSSSFFEDTGNNFCRTANILFCTVQRPNGKSLLLDKSSHQLRHRLFVRTPRPRIRSLRRQLLHFN